MVNFATSVLATACLCVLVALTASEPAFAEGRDYKKRASWEVRAPAAGDLSITSVPFRLTQKSKHSPPTNKVVPRFAVVSRKLPKGVSVYGGVAKKGIRSAARSDLLLAVVVITKAGARRPSRPIRVEARLDGAVAGFDVPAEDVARNAIRHHRGDDYEECVDRGTSRFIGLFVHHPLRGFPRTSTPAVIEYGANFSCDQDPFPGMTRFLAAFGGTAPPAS